jgi:hypothetical protein
LARPRDKIVVSLVHLLYVIIILLSSHIHFYCSYVWYTFQRSNQLKSSHLSISTHTNLVLAFTNTYYKPSLCCLELIFCRITYSPPQVAISCPLQRRPILYERERVLCLSRRGPLPRSCKVKLSIWRHSPLPSL